MTQLASTLAIIIERVCDASVTIIVGVVVLMLLRVHIAQWMGKSGTRVVGARNKR